MNFSQALEAMKAGKKIRRKCWMRGISMSIIDEGMITYKNGGIINPCPDCGSNLHDDDVMAEDWRVVE